MHEATFAHDEIIIIAMLVRQHLERSSNPAPFLEEINRKLSALANDNDEAAPDFIVRVKDTQE